MADIARALGPDTLLSTSVWLLTPPIQHLYALLVRVGIVVIDD
ncbi:hypothetical protein [Mycobacterium avium]|nr:hypothetical protein [Mycobacterium avium]